MNRRKFIKIAGGTVLASGTIGYLLSDKENLVRSDLKAADNADTTLSAEEK